MNPRREQENSHPLLSPLPPLRCLYLLSSPSLFPRLDAEAISMCVGFKTNFVNYEESGRLRCNFKSWVSKWETMHLREMAWREKKAWRSNQDLQNLIRTAEEVQCVGRGTTDKQIIWRKRKTSLVIFPVLCLSDWGVIIGLRRAVGLIVPPHYKKLQLASMLSEVQFLYCELKHTGTLTQLV